MHFYVNDTDETAAMLLGFGGLCMWGYKLGKDESLERYSA